MAKLEQLASAHESISELLHAIDPRVLIGIACVAAGIAMSELIEVRYRNPRIEVVGVSKAARPRTVDLIYTVRTAAGELDGWLFEIELSWDWEKVRRWAFYEITFETEHGADTRLVVFSPEPELRDRIRTRLLPHVKTKPVLVERDHVERIADYDEARARPELAVLGCLYHAHPPAKLAARVEVFRAAWVAIQTLAEAPARRYSVAVMSIVSAAVVEQGIAELREAGELDEGRWQLFTDSERKGHSFQRGHEEGRRETLRRAVLDVLELRGFGVTSAVRDRVESCESIEQLERWYAAAKSAATRSVDPLLGE